MDTLSSDARGFVTNVTRFVKSNGTTSSVVPKVEALFQKIAAKDRKEKVARVESSVALTPAETSALHDQLVKLLGHEVTIETVVHPHILGGIRVQVGDWVVDTTLASQLGTLAQSLKSYEY